MEEAWRSWQSSKERFTEAASTLPGLIGEVEHAVRIHRAGGDPEARREVLRVASDPYGLLRSYCRRAGRLDLSLMVADRAIRAAEDADDPVRTAAGQRNLGHYCCRAPSRAPWRRPKESPSSPSSSCAGGLLGEDVARFLGRGGNFLWNPPVGNHVDARAEGSFFDD